MISKKFIENLFSIVNDGKGLFRDTEESKFQFLELIGLVHNLGERNVMELILKNKRQYRETYNVLTNNYKLSEIVDYIKEKMPTLRVNFIDTPLLNQHAYFVSCDKIKNLGYKSNSDLKSTILETMDLLSKCNK